MLLQPPASEPSLFCLLYKIVVHFGPTRRIKNLAVFLASIHQSKRIFASIPFYIFVTGTFVIVAKYLLSYIITTLATTNQPTYIQDKRVHKIHRTR